QVGGAAEVRWRQVEGRVLVQLELWRTDETGRAVVLGAPIPVDVGAGVRLRAGPGRRLGRGRGGVPPAQPAVAVVRPDFRRDRIARVRADQVLALTRHAEGPAAVREPS